MLHLEVAETNVPAIALYHSAGWQRSGVRKAYYATPEGRIDAILMTKRLLSVT
jgi:ribosomal-protein-alanine N-acetyltransferase